MTPYIPPELVEIVIAETQRDPDTGVLPTKPPFCRNKAHLGSYSLVCRQWRPIAQALLFREIVVALERTSPAELLSFLRSAPQIAGAVRFLDFGVRSIPSWATVKDKEIPGVCPAVLMEILYYILTGVNHVKLQNLIILGWPQEVPLPARPLDLTRLVLRGVTYKPLSEPHLLPFDVLSFFCVGRLTVYNNTVTVQCADREDGSPPAVLALPSSEGRAVREIVATGPDCFLTYSIERGRTLNAEHVRSLTLNLHDRASLRFAGSLLQHYGGRATDVELNISQGAWYRSEVPIGTDFLEACSLAPCANIRCLRLLWTIASARPGYSQEDLLARLSEALSTALASTPTTLQELRFTFWEDVMGPPKDFAKVAPHVARRIAQAVGRFPHLKRVALVIEEPLTADRCTTIINDLLPKEIVDRRLVIFETLGE
ncbi:hypothetical protein GY45DRAFT_1430664 [Cubamyces sp. BRFM 1775]|nr:hypothetical protein GY45DRAFT_1430664 [Cubamyces sp. BRFM 1775]